MKAVQEHKNEGTPTHTVLSFGHGWRGGLSEDLMMIKPSTNELCFEHFAAQTQYAFQSMRAVAFLGFFCLVSLVAAQVPVIKCGSTGNGNVTFIEGGIADTFFCGAFCAFFQKIC
jgi:hypothetical protein